MRRVIAFLFAFVLFSTVASGCGIADLQSTHQSIRTAVLDAPANVACDAAIHDVATPACASFALPMLGFTQATLLLLFTQDSASAFQSYADGAVDQDGDGDADLPWGVLDVGSAAPPTVTMHGQALEWAVSETVAHLVTFTDLNADFVRWRFTTTGGAVGDRVKVWVIRRG